jgi:hypothetical protein
MKRGFRPAEVSPSPPSVFNQCSIRGHEFDDSAVWVDFSGCVEIADYAVNLLVVAGLVCVRRLF